MRAPYGPEALARAKVSRAQAAAAEDRDRCSCCAPRRKTARLLVTRSPICPPFRWREAAEVAAKSPGQNFPLARFSSA